MVTGPCLDSLHRKERLELEKEGKALHDVGNCLRPCQENQLWWLQSTRLAAFPHCGQWQLSHWTLSAVPLDLSQPLTDPFSALAYRALHDLIPALYSTALDTMLSCWSSICLRAFALAEPSATSVSPSPLHGTGPCFTQNLLLFQSALSLLPDVILSLFLILFFSIFYSYLELYFLFIVIIHNLCFHAVWVLVSPSQCSVLSTCSVNTY